MANYCFDIYESINKLSTSESVEFVNDFENEIRKEMRKMKEKKK